MPTFMQWEVDGTQSDLPKPLTDASLRAGMVSEGVSPTSIMTLASEALAAGDFVNLYDSGAGLIKARKADRSVAGKEANGYVPWSAAINYSVLVCLSGLNTRLTGLTAGAIYYLSTAGGVSASAPAAGQYVQALGRALSSSALAFRGDASRFQNLFVQASAPAGPALPPTYLWIQTGLGVGGVDMTFWVEDGL